ncbi:MAG: hypothetical protein CMA72_06805 [Euryarchaeota archaeon]|nr:hypothetical protein [Euryarchaeota archaeon]|tara:strand:+ start:1996 stop:2217 length:222 start_codon:yes stop_codon:yes gene_type:complete
MDKKQRHDIATYLLGASEMPTGISGNTQQAAFATKKLKMALDTGDIGGISDAIKVRSTAAAAYTVQTKKPWPF